MKQVTIRWSGNIRGEGAAHPDGRYAVSAPDRRVLVTHHGEVPAPHGSARFPDIPDHGDAIGCSSQLDPPVVYEWGGSGWTARGTAWGPNAVCYMGDVFYALQSADEYRATGGYRAYINGQLQTCDATRRVQDLFDCTDFGDVVVGQLDDDRYGGGVGVWFADDQVLRRLAYQELAPTGPLRAVVVKRSGDQFAITPVDEQRHVTPITWATAAELRALPAAIPVFAFDHPVLIAPFKGPVPGVVACIDDGSLGVYTELEDPSPVIAANPTRRVFVAHDAATSWAPSASVRPWDIPFIESYLRTDESVSRSVQRWYDQLRVLLAGWLGDVGVIPMFYLQSKPDASDPRGWSELWTDAQVLAGLSYLSPLVNLSPRVKIVAPFAYHRDNGITARPMLQQAFAALLAAGSTNVLLPAVGPPPPPPRKPPVPDPPVPPSPTEPDVMADGPVQFKSDDDKTQVCNSFGQLLKVAFPTTVTTKESAAQGVRQALDQGVADMPTLLIMALAREQDHSPDKRDSIAAVEAAAAAGRLLPRR